MIDNIINMIYNCLQYQIYDITKGELYEIHPETAESGGRRKKIYLNLNLKDRTYIEEQYDKKLDNSSFAIAESFNSMYGYKKKKNILILLTILSLVFFAVGLILIFVSSSDNYNIVSAVSSLVFVVVAVVFNIISFIIYRVIKSYNENFTAFLFTLFIIKITGGEIDEYLDEPSIKANLKNLPLFKIEENAMIKIPEENIKNMSMQAENSFDKTRSDSLSSDPVKDEMAEKRLAEIKKKFRISHKKASVVRSLQAMAFVSLIICLLFLLIPVVKTGENSSQNLFSLIIYDFKLGFPRRAGSQTGDGYGVYDFSALAFGSDKAWQTAIYPFFTILSAFIIIVETLRLIVLIVNSIKLSSEKKRIQKMSEEDQMEFMKMSVMQEEDEDATNFSVFSIIKEFIVSTLLPLIFIFTLAVTMFYPLYLISKATFLSLVCEINLGGMVMALLFGILYFFLMLITNIMSVKYDLYIHENNDRYE